jgi:general secretion pathway protein I
MMPEPFVSNKADRLPHEEGGFSVVETLVALFVFALAAVALISMQSQSIDTYEQVETRALASVVAENQLVEVLARIAPPQPGSSEGEVLFGNRNWRWKLEVLATDDASTLRLRSQVFLAGQSSPAATLQAYRSVEGGT